VLEVADTGIGIGAEDLPHLFERFYRAREARSRSHEGTGIGLSLVQELVKLHGGTIDVTSRPGEGTTFSVALPRGTAHLPKDRIGARSGVSTGIGASAFVDEAHHWLPEEVVSHAGAAAPATSSGRILVADDNADMREYVTRLLAQHWSVEAVADGQAALERAREDPPDLLLTDVMMPRLDGFALLEALRADPRTAAIPIIPAVGARGRGSSRRRPRGVRRRLPGQAVRRARADRSRQRAPHAGPDPTRDRASARRLLRERGPRAALARVRRHHPARQPRRARDAGLCARGIRRPEHRGVSRGRVRRRRPPGATARRPVDPQRPGPPALPGRLDQARPDQRQRPLGRRPLRLRALLHRRRDGPPTRRGGAGPPAGRRAG